MRKKILVAEKSDAIRNIAESILHQHGFDVITASDCEEAKALVLTTEPNMIITGADLQDSTGHYLYEMLEENDSTASIPLLIIADPEGREISYPEEVILPRPFDPKDFIDRVILFVGGSIEKKTEERVEMVDPFSSDTINDDMLDSALGLDGIEVEESEEVDKADPTGKVKSGYTTEKRDIFDIRQPEYDDKAHNGKENEKKVESLMIRDEKTAPEEENNEQKHQSSSTKIEIDTDQYGMTSPSGEDEDMPERQVERPHEHHDYDWFINEMQKETDPHSKDDKGDREKHYERAGTGSKERPGEMKGEVSEGRSVAIDGDMKNFIQEFKKEVADIKAQVAARQKGDMNSGLSEEPRVSENNRIPVTSVKNDDQAEDKSAPTATEKTEDEIRDFANHLIEVLSEKLAKKIVDKINKDEVYAVVKEDLSKLIAGKSNPTI